MSTFSKRLKQKRILKDWSKTQTAKKLGISVQRYSNWEYGYRQPDFDMLKQIAELFETSTDYLIGKSDNPNPISNFTNNDENQLLISYRKHTAEMSPDEKRRFQRSINHLMEAAKELNQGD